MRQYDETTGQVLASDALILYFNEGPIAAKVSPDNSKKLVLIWDVQMTNSTGQITRMLYRASYFKADGAATVRAVPSGYDNSFESRGKCRPV